jgi:hypothetical protein
LAPRQRARAAALAIALVIGLATLTPTEPAVSAGPWCILCGDLAGVDIVLNVLLFIPFGIALFLAGVPWFMAAVVAFAFSFSIEIAQVDVIAGRDASVRDLLTNSLGGIIGVAIGAAAPLLIRPAPRTAAGLSAAWAVGVALVQGLGSYAFAPDATGRPYFGQVGRSLGGNPAYPGRIVTANLDGTSIPNTRYRDDSAAAAALASPSGALVEVSVVPGREPAWLASMVRIIGVQRDEVMLLAQDHDGVVFGVRTRSASLRLRPVRTRLARGFDAEPAQGTPDTILIEARQSARTAEIRASGAADAHVLVRLTPGHVWRFFAPRQAYVTGGWSDALAGIVWLGAIFAPFGYWLRRTAVPSHPAARATVRRFALALFLPATVLGFMPIVMAVAPARWFEWIAAVLGIAVGAGLAARAAR